MGADMCFSEIQTYDIDRLVSLGSIGNYICCSKFLLLYNVTNKIVKLPN